MYTYKKMPGSLEGIDSMQFSVYWQAIKDRIADLQSLPAWTTNHAMKLGIAVTNLKARGRNDLVALLQDEIDKVNDDIKRAWKVKGYIDSYLPDWMSQASAQDSPNLVTQTMPPSSAPSAPDQMQITPIPDSTPPDSGSGIIASVQSGFSSFTQSVYNFFGGGGVSGVGDTPWEQGLGIIPIIIGAAALAALAYVVTTGMALYQDYVTKKDLTQSVIEGKLTSGQASQLMVAARPPDEATGILPNIMTGIGTNVGTIAVLGVVGYLGFLYLMRKV